PARPADATPATAQSLLPAARPPRARSALPAGAAGAEEQSARSAGATGTTREALPAGAAGAEEQSAGSGIAAVAPGGDTTRLRIDAVADQPSTLTDGIEDVEACAAADRCGHCAESC